MDHFVSCSSFGTETQKGWRDIFDNDCEKQKEIGRFVQRGYLKRQDILEKSRIRETKHLSTDADSSTDTTVHCVHKLPGLAVSRHSWAE